MRVLAKNRFTELSDLIEVQSHSPKYQGRSDFSYHLPKASAQRLEKHHPGVHDKSRSYLL